jgi:hypothetical protein
MSTLNPFHNIVPPSLPLPFLPISPFGKVNTVYSKKNICLSLFVCLFIYYIIIIILDCILISLIDFFIIISPYVICRLMIRCVLLLRKYTYSLTIEVPNFPSLLAQDRAKSHGTVGFLSRTTQAEFS